MIEAPVPRYTDVPCRGLRAWCQAGVGQPCPGGTSHRVRRQLWEAMAQAQDRGEYVLGWYGFRIQITTRLRKG